MGTTDNFDSGAGTRGVATMTIPVLQAANAGAKNLTLDQVAPFTGRFRHMAIGGNLGTLSSLGTSTAGIATQTWYIDVFIPLPGTLLTGIGILNAATVGTDKGLVSLYDSTGALVANSALAGVTTSGANAFQQYPFTATYTTLKPGRFWIGYTSNGTTDNFRTVATATWIDVLSTIATGGTFGTIVALSPPTTFTAGQGPISYAY